MRPPNSAQVPFPQGNKFSLQAPRRRSPISLTPLIDVVFILLIFFMLASSFLDWRSIDMNAPAKAAASSSTDNPVLVVDLRTDGPRISGTKYTVEALVAHIVQQLKEKPNRPVVVKPAAGVVFQDAITVLDQLSTAGVRTLSLARNKGT